MRKCMLFLAVAAVAFAIPSTARAGDLYVNSSGTCSGGTPCYSTIQAAVGAAVADDVIHVEPGTYVESGQIVIGVDLTISGDPSDKPVIMAGTDTGDTGDTRAWFLVNDGIRFDLDNVILDGDGNSSGTGKKVFIGILSHGHGTISDCTFRNIWYTLSSDQGRGVCLYDSDPGEVARVEGCDFSNIARIGIFVFGAGSTRTIHNNTYTGKGVGDWLDYGIELSGGATATCTNNTVTNCRGVLSSNGSTSAGMIATDYHAPGTVGTFTNNTLTDNTAGIGVGYLETDATVVTANFNDIHGNDTGIFTDSTAVLVDGENNWWGDASGPGGEGPGSGDAVSVNVDYSPWLGATPGSSPMTWVVDDSIQDAIDNASAGDTITVTSGTYVGDILIPAGKDNLEIVAGGTTIKGVAVEPQTNWPLANPNIEILSDGVKLHGFDIESPDVPEDYYSSGIVLSGENIEIYDNNFISIGYGVDANTGGFCVVIQTYRDDVLGYNSDIDGLHIHDNTFTGTPAGLYDAVFINHQGETVVDYVTIEDNTYSGKAYRCAFTERSMVKILDNTMATSASADAGQGIVVLDFDQRAQDDVQVTNNSVDGFPRGVVIGYSGGVQTLTNISVTGNTITNSGTAGVQVRSSANSVALNTNNISGNTLGVENLDSANTLDATNNWWGDASGPLDATGTSEVDGPGDCNANSADDLNADGAGDAVTDNVDYCPWWAATAPFVSLDVVSGLDCNTNGGIIEVELNVHGLDDMINGVQVLMQYDTSLMSLCRGTASPPCDSAEAAGWSRIALLDNFGGTPGYVIYALSYNQLGGGGVGPGVGPFTVATLRFKAIAEGISTVDFRPDAGALKTKLTRTADNTTILPNKVDSDPISIDDTEAVASSNSPVCENTTIELYGDPDPGVGPNPPYTYAWTGPDSFASSLQDPTIPNAAQVNEGTYYLTITNSNGCEFADQTDVVVNELPVADAGLDYEICSNGSDPVVGGSPTGSNGLPPYTYVWTGSGAAYLSDTTAANPTFDLDAAYAAAGGEFTYTVCVEVTDANGCVSALIDCADITIWEQPVADAGPDYAICSNGTDPVVGGTPTATLGTGPYTYLWTG
ncbi:MAG: right-handed parallel beta-helix repeat-containing protein, partial [Phycisphaerae bacterium]|nr:right-handed parallel beta-helix repeat-containing protein [Phycisphaerae bacterium]